MRIAHVIDYFHTDVGYQEYYLALAQAAAGHSVRVVTSDRRHGAVARPGPDGDGGEAALAGAGVEVVRLGSRQLGHDRAWLRGLAAAVDAFRPDVAHVHTPFSPTTVRVAAIAAKRDIGLLVDTHVQDAIAPGAGTGPGRVAYAAYRRLCGPLLRRRVGDWVANGPDEASFLVSRLGLPPAAVAMEPLGFDPLDFPCDPDRRLRLRHCRGWDDEVVVAVTGKLHSGKRPDAVAAACERAGRDQPVRLVLAGAMDEPTTAAVRRAAPDLERDGRLEVGPMLRRADLADLYLAADVVVFARLPSISIYEAAGTGARVVVGDVRLARWLGEMHPGIEPLSAAGLDAHITPLTCDRAELAAGAVKAFSWPVVSDAFVERYRRLR